MRTSNENLLLILVSSEAKQPNRTIKPSEKTKSFPAQSAASSSD